MKALIRQPYGVAMAQRQRGAVLVVVLIGISLLVGLIFFVYNLGDQVNRRVVSQGTSDAVAVSGAGWMARSMNIIAMDNVTTSRMISLSAVLDSLPLAAEMTIAEETGENRLPEALERWQSPGTEGFTPYERDNFFRRGLAEIYRQMNPGTETHLDLLQEIDRTFDQSDELAREGGYNVGRATEWNSGSGRGYIWRACLAMDEFSRVALDSAGVLAQDDAALIGFVNGANVSFIVPILPKLPGRRTNFDDYAPLLADHISYGTDGETGEDIHAVGSSRLVERLATTHDTAREARRIYVRGGAIPDFEPPHRLGPFARLYRWRDYWDQYESDFARTYMERWGYTTYGPMRHMLRRIVSGFGQAGGHGGIIDTSRFAFHLQTLAQVKLAYMLGLDSPVPIQYSDEWITDYDEAEKFVEDDRERMEQLQQQTPTTPVKSNVMTTRYYCVNVKSTVKWDNLSNWMNVDAWQEDPPTLTFVPRRWWSWQLTGRGPYGDPTAHPLSSWISDRGGWSPIGNTVGYDQAKGIPYSSHPEKTWIEIDSSGQVWYRKWRNEKVRFDRELGLPERIKLDEKGEPILDDQGNPEYEYYTIYYIEFRVFGGIEIRNEVMLSNPLAGAGRDDLPAPVLIDTTVGDYDPEEPYYDIGTRREHFSYLGVARRGAAARVWNQQFRSGNPADAITTVAQAVVFNNKSWDLWTQDWQTQLVPVSRWSEWMDLLGEGTGDIDQAGGDLQSDEIQSILDYFNSINPEMIDIFMNH